MQAVLISMKWKGEGKPKFGSHEGKNYSTIVRDRARKGRDDLRRTLLILIDVESSRERVIELAQERGYGIEDIEIVLEELVANGLVIVPIYGVLKKP
jgi:hypothetical protein